MIQCQAALCCDVLSGLVGCDVESSCNDVLSGLVGCDVGGRWRDLLDVCVRHIDDHLSTFYDAHLLMAYLGANSTQHVDEFLQSLHNYVRSVHFSAVDFCELLKMRRKTCCCDMSQVHHVHSAVVTCDII